MIAYHGTIKQKLTTLNPRANPLSNLGYACVYLTTYQPLAALYIWNREYKWMNFSFAEDGMLQYTESFPNALQEFYGGVSGCIYTCDGDFEFDANAKIHIAVVSRAAVSVVETEVVDDAYERILKDARQGLLRISRYELLTEKQRQSEHNMILAAIKRNNLLAETHPMSGFVRKKFPDIWEEARKI